MSKSLKYYAIAYEVPFLDVTDQSGQAELAKGICDKYRNWFYVLDVDLKILQLPNENYMLLFYIIVSVDPDIISVDSVELDWNTMMTELSEIIEKFLKDRNLIYRVIK